MKKILVIGATGMIGQPVTRVLLQSPHEFTLLARNQRKAQAIFPDAKIVDGDVFDPFSLLPVFEGKDIVYISLGPARNARKNDRMSEEEGIDNIVSVAQQTGVKRLVLVSSLVQHYNNTNGYHWWIFDIKQRAVEKIKASGIPYTIFYPSTFMEGFDQLMMRGSNILLAGKSKAPMYFIAAKDFGLQAAKSFSLPEGVSKEYVVQGPEAHTMDDGAKLFMENYSKRKLTIMRAPMPVMRLLANFSPAIDYGVKIVEALNNYPEQFEAQQTWNDLGKPETTIKEYAKQLA